MRNLLIPSTASKAFIRSKKVSFVLTPKSPMFTPVNTISFPPSLAACSAWATNEAIVGFRENPRAKGIVQ